MTMYRSDNNNDVVRSIDGARLLTMSLECLVVLRMQQCFLYSCAKLLHIVAERLVGTDTSLSI